MMTSVSFHKIVFYYLTLLRTAYTAVRVNVNVLFCMWPGCNNLADARYIKITNVMDMGCSSGRT